VGISEHEELEEFINHTFQSVTILARALHVKDTRLQPTLDAIVAMAVSTLSSARYAGLILVSRGELVPQATTGQPPHLLDLLQQKLGGGPCIDTGQDQSVTCITDTQQDDRWPDFSAQAAHLGIFSLLCVPLWVDERCLGTLSLYADHADAFGDHDERVAGLFATLAALALAGAQRTDQLSTALANRDVIGQAKGILMERQRITADVAFAHLAQVSQAENIKLTAVCRHLVETGELLGARTTDR
jgi:GAF domain-containing protein